MLKTTLYEHQKHLLETNPRRCLLAWETGTGKTLALLALVEKNADNALIVCPKGMKMQWKNKIEEYGVTKPCMIMSKEEFRRDSPSLPSYHAVIIDEVHHFSGHTSKMHKNTVKYFKRTHPYFVWSGTATPYRREPFNIWALGVIHGTMPLSWVKFRQQFYHIRYLGNRMIWEANQGEETRAQLLEYMKPWCNMVTLNECFDMPEQVDESPELLGLTKEQNKAIATKKLEESNPAVLYGAMHQIEQGCLKGNEFVDNACFENNKIERIVDLADENPKLLIFARYTMQIASLRERLKQEGHSVYVIDGSNGDQHFSISQECERAERCVLIAQISVAAGWEVPGIPIVVYASMSYSYLDYVQSRGRVIRGNKLSRHVFMYLHSGKIDQAVWKCILEKKDFDPVGYTGV